MFPDFNRDAAWTVDQMLNDQAWIFPMIEDQARQLANTVKQVYSPDRPLFDYRPEEFDFGSGLKIIKAAAQEAYFGRGVALVKGLPRAELSGPEYQILTWGIGLCLGVPRPQGRMTHYISAVREAGGSYRHAGR